MEQEGGGGGGGGEETAAKCANPSGTDEDRLSALPDDVLVLFLLRLDTCEAARTSVLSRRWRRVWALLPELHFFSASDPHRIRDVLEAGEVALRSLFVTTRGAAPDSVAAWLPAAARRLSGRLFFHNLERKSCGQEDDEEAAAQRGAFELPCLESATRVSLHLGLLGLAVPPAGVFARLTELRLNRVQFHGPCELGDAVSSQRCPRLQKLTVHDARGLGNLAVHSDSLQEVELDELRGLCQLIIVARALKVLTVMHCFCYDENQPVASILAPQLLNLKWMDLYDPSSVHLGEMEHLQFLMPSPFLVYGQNSWSHSSSCLSLLARFKVIEGLSLRLVYMEKIDDYDYLMEDMTMLPDIMFLNLTVLANGHAFGASAFHVLSMCSGIRKLKLSLIVSTDMEAQTTCSSGCICGEQQNWRTEQLLLNRLQEVEIILLRGSGHEITFMKQLFKWATVLEKMMVTFDDSVTASMAKELCQVLRSISSPKICMEFYMYKDIFEVPYAPEDQGVGSLSG